LKDDKQATFSAASHAQHAADFLHDLQKATFLRPTRREGAMARPDIIIVDGHAYAQGRGELRPRMVDRTERHHG
jgi:hypothetical protein